MTWRPEIPPWYPDLGPFHNPFAMNGDTGSAAQTLYADWCDKIGAEELQRLIREYKERQET